jgi:hypothetical protein
MSTCAMKCLKALLSSDQRLPRRWFHTIFADLLPQITSSDHLAARSVLAILVELIEKSPRDEGITSSS